MGTVIRTAAAGAQGGGGATALTGLTDITIATPTDGQVLTYDNTSGKWVNEDAASGGGGGDIAVDDSVTGNFDIQEATGELEETGTETYTYKTIKSIVVDDTGRVFTLDSDSNFRHFSLSEGTFTLENYTTLGYSFPTMGYLSGSDFAVVDRGGEKLCTVRYNGTSFSEVVGSALTFPTASYAPQCCTLNSTTAIVGDAGRKVLEAYTWNGSSWSLTGTPKSFTYGETYYMCKLDDSHIVWIDRRTTTGGELTVFNWDGSVFTQVGNALSIPNIANNTAAIGLARLKENRILYHDTTNQVLKFYDWNGTDFIEGDATLSLAGPVQMAALTENSFVGSKDKYVTEFTISADNIITDNGTTGEIGHVFFPNASVTITGGANDGTTFTVGSMTDNQLVTTTALTGETLTGGTLTVNKTDGLYIRTDDGSFVYRGS